MRLPSFLQKAALPPVLAAALSLTVAGCEKKENAPASAQPETPAPKDGTISGHAYSVITEGPAGIRLTDADVSGNGTLLFHTSPGDVKSNIEYRLTFTVEDGGSLSLVSHASDTLADGTGITIARTGDLLAAKTQPQSDTGHSLADTAAAGELNLVITVHNTETPPHITVAAAAVLFDSQADGVSLPQGQGSRFGISLSQAVLKNLSFTQVKDDDHGGPQEFTVADLHTVGQKAISRFERMAIASSQFMSYKTWKTSDYIWVRLTYSIPDAASATDKKEEMIYLACHFHGKDMGCHKKDEAGPDEPKDDVPGDDPFPDPDPIPEP